MHNDRGYVRQPSGRTQNPEEDSNRSLPPKRYNDANKCSMLSVLDIGQRASESC